MTDLNTEFFSALCGPGGHLTVVRGKQPEGKKKRGVLFANPEHQGPWEEIIPAAMKEVEGRDIDLYLIPNSNAGAVKTDKEGRKTANRDDAAVKEFRSLFLDKDGAKEGFLAGRDEEVADALSSWFGQRFQTSAEVESSPGRRHYYWFLGVNLDVATWRADERAILDLALNALTLHFAEELGGRTFEELAAELTREAREEDPEAKQITVGDLTGLDSSATNPSRLLRVPGSLHVRKECISSVLSCSGRKLNHDDLLILPAPVQKGIAPRPIAKRSNKKEKKYTRLWNAVKEQGLILSDRHEGKWELECYNADAHTNGDRGGAVLFDPSENNGWTGSYKCSHTHCSHLNFEAAIKALCPFTEFSTFGDPPKLVADTGTLFIAEEAVAGLWFSYTQQPAVALSDFSEAVVETGTGWALREELAFLALEATTIVVLLDSIPDSYGERLAIVRLAAVLVRAGKIVRMYSPAPSFEVWAKDNASLAALLRLPSHDPMLWAEAQELQTETLEAFKTLSANTSDAGVAATIKRNAGKGGLVCPDGAPESRKFRQWNDFTKRWDALSHVDSAVDAVTLGWEQHAARLKAQADLAGSEGAKHLLREAGRIIGWCTTTGGSARLRADVSKLLARDPELRVPHDKFDANPDILGVANGILDLRTGNVRPARREDYVSVFLETPLVDEIPDTPEVRRFLQYLDEISALDHGDTSQESRDRRTLLEEHCATSLFGDNKLKAIQYWVGGGDNAKTLQANVLQDVLGDLAAPVASAALFSETAKKQDNQHGHTGGLNQLIDKRAGFCPELSRTAVVRADILKSISGDDKLSLRQLNQESSPHQLSVAIFVLTNHLPRVPDGDPAILKRTVLYDFRNQWLDLDKEEGKLVAKARAEAGERPLPEADKDLKFVFKHPSVKQAFLRIIVNAAVRLANNKFSFTVSPKSITDLYSGYRKSLNPFLDWLEDSPYVLGNGYVTKAEVFDSFNAWLESEGQRRVSSRTFMDRMESFLSGIKECKVIAMQEGKEPDGRARFVVKKATGHTPGQQRGLHGLVRKGQHLKIVSPPADAPPPCLDDEVGT